MDCGETTGCYIQTGSLQAKPETYPVSGIMCSHGGHRMFGQMAKAFSSAQTPRHCCRPGMTSLLKAVQSKKALLAMYLSEGGIASSGRAAQFMKALTLMVWRVIGRLTSLRLVQCTKVNSCISSICVFERSTFLSRWQLSQACAPMTLKLCGNASVAIPVELRQPRATARLGRDSRAG